MPLPIHQHAFKAAQASVCASEQGKFWQYHDRLFASADLSPNALKRIAAEVGLKQDAFNSCMASDRSRTAVEKDIAEADQLGVRGTPTFVVNGRGIRGATTFGSLKQEIDGALIRMRAGGAAPGEASDALLLLPTDLRSTLPLVQNTTPRQARSDSVRAVEASSVTINGVTLSPATINFGYQLVGTTGPEFIETVTNSGSTPLIITDISVSGRYRGNFQPTYNFSLPATVAPGGSIAINLSFTPALPWRAGTRNATLEISERKDSQYVPLSGIGATCGGPLPSCSSGCPDTDGDGLNDAWETAGGIDLDNDGVIDAAKGDVLLPGANRYIPDIFVQYDWLDYGLGEWACTTDSQCTALGGAHLGETCVGGKCVFACVTDTDCTDGVHNSCSSNNDCAAGSFCDNATHQCQRGPWHAGEQCRANPLGGNACYHTHDPEITAPGALQKVMDRFALHNINLHVIRGRAFPHSRVVSFRQDDLMTDGCEGGSVALGNVGIGKYAVSLYDLKHASSPDRLNIAYHYAVFGHSAACDTVAHCQPFNSADSNNRVCATNADCTSGGFCDPATLTCQPVGCLVAYNPDGTPKNAPQPGESGLAEISGNDFVVTLGGLVNDTAQNPQIVSAAGFSLLGSTFMHELGHNLGLHHGGGIDTPCHTTADCAALGLSAECFDVGDGQGKACHVGEEFPVNKPNYLSVMNYRYQLNGIFAADAVGSSIRNPALTRLDYSNKALPTGGNTPGVLTQTDLNEPAGLGSGTADLFNFRNGACDFLNVTAPTEGPVDWDGDGDFTGTHVQADTTDDPITCLTNPSYPALVGYADWPDASGIPFNYKFQCTSTGGPLGDGVAPLSMFPGGEWGPATH
jgi:hypothetical protein